jgi:hypothetical protein
MRFAKGLDSRSRSRVYPTSAASLMTKSGKPDLVRGNERRYQRADEVIE